MGKYFAAAGIGFKTKGEIDLSETYLDGSFSAAKKGAPELERLSGARVPRSWQLQTEMVFPSPFAHMKQTHTGLSSLKRRYLAALSEQGLNGS